jgi:signal transduction histidine kinase
MTNQPRSEEHIQKTVTEINAHLSELAASALPPGSENTLQEAMRLVEQLSIQISTSQDSYKQDLKQVEQERNNFISVVTHELRLPMTSIKGYTDLLRQGVVGQINEQQLSFLDTIRSNVDRMSALLSDLSDISRINTGRMMLDIKALDIEKALNEVLQSLKPAWEKKNQQVEVALPASLPTIAADYNRLLQVMVNLLRNAIMYTPEGGKVTLQVKIEGEQLRIEVVDNGIGMKSEDQARLFSPFFRSDDAYVRDQPGWGTSLHVSSKLVQIMGGSIGMYSQADSGSVFWFSLPLYVDG